MWTCPKCGRTFKRWEQDHYCGKVPETIEEYIAMQPEEIQQYLKEVRDVLRAALPEAEERISWSMPTYWKGHNIIHFAGFKNHVGLYPGPEGIGRGAENGSECVVFFDGKPEALPLYEAFEKRVFSEVGGVKVKAQKTQIAFSNRHKFHTSCPGLRGRGDR